MQSATDFLRDGGLLGLVEGLDVEDKPRFDAVDPHLLTASEQLALRRLGPPELAADEDLTVAAELADLADDRLWTHRDRRAPYLDRLRDREGPGGAEHRCDRDDPPEVGVVGRRRVPEQHHRPDHEGDH